MAYDWKGEEEAKKERFGQCFLAPLRKIQARRHVMRRQVHKVMYAGGDPTQKRNAQDLSTVKYEMNFEMRRV